jgi:DNA-binding response OmpR family regulator
MKILFIEDDPVLANIVIDYLQESYTIEHAFDTIEAQNLIDKNKYDLFIFDVNIPFKSGIEFLKELRDFNILTPAIMLTAYDDTARVKASFDAGAHDYIRKPFELEELKIRVERSIVLFRIDNSISFKLDNEVVYYPKKRLVINRDKEYTLRPKDTEILDYFIANPHRLISTEELSQNLWEFNQLPSDATLRSYIRNIRNIIGSDKITTQRGVGYRYE